MQRTLLLNIYKCSAFTKFGKPHFCGATKHFSACGQHGRPRAHSHRWLAEVARPSWSQMVALGEKPLFWVSCLIFQSHNCSRKPTKPISDIGAGRLCTLTLILCGDGGVRLWADVKTINHETFQCGKGKVAFASVNICHPVSSLVASHGRLRGLCQLPVWMHLKCRICCLLCARSRQKHRFEAFCSAFQQTVKSHNLTVWS